MTDELKRIIILPILKKGRIEKIKCYLTNRAIVLSIILIGTILLFTYKTYIDYGSLNPIITLIATSLVTSSLLILREGYKSENRKTELEYAFNNELTRNLIYLLRNNNKLNEELKVLKSGNRGFHRLRQIQFNIYEMMIQSFPEELFKKGYLAIEDYFDISGFFNNTIIYKEKITFQNNPNIKAVIELDEELTERIGKLIDYICILLGPNLKVAILENEVFKELENTKDLKNFLDSKIEIMVGDYNTKYKINKIAEEDIERIKDVKIVKFKKSKN